MRRRHLIQTGIGLGLAAAAPAMAAGREVRIGFQKYGKLVLLKEAGTLDERLKALDVAVTWTEFPGGPQLLEALNVGAIDFGNTGEAPPIFAQAAGAPLRYVGFEPPTPTGEAILVPANSPLQSAADLKGKRVALNKGSNVHYLLVKALESAGVRLDEIEVHYLPPADGRAAFEAGDVDAWAIWDPFLAAAQAATGARVLVDGTGLVQNHQFYLAAQRFLEEQPDLLEVFLAELARIDDWAKGNQEEVAERLSPKTGIPAPVLALAIGRLGFGIRPLTPEVTAAQQGIADTFLGLGLIPRPIDVASAVWRTPS